MEHAVTGLIFSQHAKQNCDLVLEDGKFVRHKMFHCMHPFDNDGIK